MDGLQPTNYPPGQYVARAFINDSFTKVGESPVFDIVTLINWLRSAIAPAEYGR